MIKKLNLERIFLYPYPRKTNAKTLAKSPPLRADQLKQKDVVELRNGSR